MWVVGSVCVVLLVLTTVIHYEVLRALTVGLPRFRIPARSKLIVVILGAFVAHAVEIVLYALCCFCLISKIRILDKASIKKAYPMTFWTCCFLIFLKFDKPKIVEHLES